MKMKARTRTPARRHVSTQGGVAEAPRGECDRSHGDPVFTKRQRMAQPTVGTRRRGISAPALAASGFRAVVSHYSYLIQSRDRRTRVACQEASRAFTGRAGGVAGALGMPVGSHVASRQLHRTIGPTAWHATHAPTPSACASREVSC